jgi:hypothetical protein
MTDIALPHLFCVKARQGTREGYFLLRWSTGHTDTNGRVVHVIKPMNHQGRFYTIDTIVVNTTQHNHITRKGQGNVTRPMHWNFTDKRLRDPDGMRIPVLHVTSRTTLPAMKPTSFIPIIENVPNEVQPNQVQPNEVQPNQVQPNQVQPNQVLATVQTKKYTITSIPQHVVRALLTNAVMNSETCPITSEDIDVSNGAVTSCFHFFEKNAIIKWLLMPNSKDECPLCKTPCNSYTIE